MPWTEKQKVDALMLWPWTVRVSRDEEEGYMIAEVEELPPVTATGMTPEELDQDFWAALRATLEVLVADGDRIPLPPLRDRLPWDAADGPVVLRVNATVTNKIARVEGVDVEATAA